MRDHLVEHPATCEETPALIEHILERYHETHRRELPELVALAQKVERVHGTDPNAPHGLAEALKAMNGLLEAHMQKEETHLFPAMLQAMLPGRADAAAQPIAGMRHDHAEHEEALDRIAAITHGFRLPADACNSWRRLYAGTRKLVDDLDEHIRLENDVLFPRFAGGGRGPLAGA
jgi:regulator of cell morphogenesis and NO signaling